MIDDDVMGTLTANGKTVSHEYTRRDIYHIEHRTSSYGAVPDEETSPVMLT